MARKVQEIIKSPKETMSREDYLVWLKADMERSAQEHQPIITEYRAENAVQKPDVSSLPPAVTFTDDGEPEFLLKKGDKILIERPYPNRQTVINEVWRVDENGYLLTWSEENSHFEALDDWRIAEKLLGYKLRIPTGKVKQVRLTKEERAQQRVDKRRRKEKILGIERDTPILENGTKNSVIDLLDIPEENSTVETQE